MEFPNSGETQKSVGSIDKDMFIPNQYIDP